jgi:magnesium chelatase subunit D
LAAAESGCRSHGKRFPAVRLAPADVRFKLRLSPTATCTLFVVDASGSMAARRRMAAAKGAVLSLLLEAYQRRDEVGLIAFRQSSASLILAPTSSAEQAYARLRDLPTGGRTPLASALQLALATFTRRPTATPFLVLISDGRANVSVHGADPFAEAIEAARGLRAASVPSLVVDTEQGQVCLGLARRLADELGARYVRLPELTPTALRALV